MPEHSSPSVTARHAELTMPPAATRHPQHDHLLILWVFNRRGSRCSLFRKPLATPQPKPSSKRLCSHRRRSQRVRKPAARLHGYHLHLSWCPDGAAAILFPNFSLKRQTHTGALHPAARPQRARTPPQPSPPRLDPIAKAQPGVPFSKPSQSGRPRGGGRGLPPGRGGSDMAAGREGEGAGEPPGGWSQAAPPEPAASRRVQTSGSWRAAARLGAVPPAPGASARAHAQARRRQVRALPLAAGGLLRCGAAPLEPAGARFGNKQQRAVFPNPSAPAAGRGVEVCARGAARREAGCGLRPRVPRFIPHPPPPAAPCLPPRIFRRLAPPRGFRGNGRRAAASRRPCGGVGASPLLHPTRRPLSVRGVCWGNGRGYWRWWWAHSPARPQAQVAGLVGVS
ncbi:uncharacterized protein LOC116243210 [Phasianus colchicus]|uniref:uncharacterized protein LOC116243210 n=1 Tax=Phasianus colchicus TaxID=9054 RepID=UPI00129DBFD4|nr:uncharacterized protein LOC116243210 [Phasianus colchicus]